MLLTAFSMKLYSWAAFLILRAQGLQTRSDKFSFLVNRNPTDPQQGAKISPALSTLPTAKINFQMRLVLPRRKVNSTKSTTAFFFWRLHWVSVRLLQIFVGVTASTFCCEDFLMVYSYETALGDTFPREVSHAEKRAPNYDWSLKWQLG